MMPLYNCQHLREADSPFFIASPVHGWMHPRMGESSNGDCKGSRNVATTVPRVLSMRGGCAQGAITVHRGAPIIIPPSLNDERKSFPYANSSTSRSPRAAALAIRLRVVVTETDSASNPSSSIRVPCLFFFFLAHLRAHSVFFFCLCHCCEHNRHTLSNWPVVLGTTSTTHPVLPEGE